VNLVAIDIAKEWNVALVQDRSGQRRRFKFANRFADYNEFVAYLRSLTGPFALGWNLLAIIIELPCGLDFTAVLIALSRSPVRHLGQERSQGRAGNACDDGTGLGAGFTGTHYSPGRTIGRNSPTPTSK
jgi:hypothetical protein